MLRPILVLALLVGAVAPTPASARSMFCHAQNSSPRAVGLIVSPVFDARGTSPAWLRQAFTNFLRSSFAPYGNNWLFRDESAACADFDDVRQAQAARDRLILLEQRGGANIYNVTFVG